MRKLAMGLVVTALLSMGSGCVGRAVSEAMGKVTGAKGITIVIDPVSQRSRDIALVEYTRFELGTFTDEFGKTPPALLPLLKDRFERQLAAKKIPNTSGKTLLIRGKIIHYEDATRAVSQVFGPFEEVVARVELVDKSSGKVLGVANCIGRSRETVNQGVEKKADGLAEAIVSWIAAHYPKTEND